MQYPRVEVGEGLLGAARDRASRRTEDEHYRGIEGYEKDFCRPNHSICCPLKRLLEATPAWVYTVDKPTCTCTCEVGYDPPNCDACTRGYVFADSKCSNATHCSGRASGVTDDGTRASCRCQTDLAVKSAAHAMLVTSFSTATDVASAS